MSEEIVYRGVSASKYWYRYRRHCSLGNYHYAGTAVEETFFLG